jgi:hypothetical protein
LRADGSKSLRRVLDVLSLYLLMEIGMIGLIESVRMKILIHLAPFMVIGIALVVLW